MKYFAQTLLDEMLKWYIFEILSEHTTAPWASFARGRCYIVCPVFCNNLVHCPSNLISWSKVQYVSAVSARNTSVV